VNIRKTGPDFDGDLDGVVLRVTMEKCDGPSSP